MWARGRLEGHDGHGLHAGVLDAAEEVGGDHDGAPIRDDIREPEGGLLAEVQFALVLDVGQRLRRVFRRVVAAVAAETHGVLQPIVLIAHEGRDNQRVEYTRLPHHREALELLAIEGLLGGEFARPE